MLLIQPFVAIAQVRGHSAVAVVLLKKPKNLILIRQQETLYIGEFGSCHNGFSG